MKRYSGMTLLEVLVALTIFSLAALSLLQGLGQLATGTGRLEEKTWADWTAENQLVELRLKKVWPPLRWTAGESEQAGRRWYWRWRGVETHRAEVRTLEIEVSSAPWHENRSPVTVLRTYVVRQ
ncbi:type II secretion system minor pseudopilin GspI [Mixta tenebrionis]|uniref:Type II secretion system protein I n=1 Tax=Mixta tenebrionis TaxID=2562439 RepID=A0A506V5Q0_9GAMM|nr:MULTISPECIES: type II secretion system minor pseudopilin GspI [Mixta]QHM76287.1 Type II secretion system protein I [Mixta theicola]TPW41224.1 type II secretion system protein GspI [Mixta tenebrionis]